MQITKFKPMMTEQIKPVTDTELFLHCSGGRTSVTEKEFNKTVRPLLLAHGVLDIRVV